MQECAWEVLVWPQEPQKECDVSALTATHCVFLFVWFAWLFVALFVCSVACLLVCLLVCLFVCLVAWLLGCLFVCLFVWLLGCLVACLCVCLFVCLSVCLSACVFFSFFVGCMCNSKDGFRCFNYFNCFSKNACPDVSMRKLADSPCGTDSASKSRLFCQQFCSVLFDTYCSLKPNSF